jgi:tripartite-type tricarboxylate transporter receptor subunit TctC
MTFQLPRRSLLLAAAGSAAATFAPALRAQAWPSRPMRFVVPFAPGGSSEIMARATAGELTKLLGQNVFVDNKPGGAGNVAMSEVARADDQHTLILGHIGTLAVNPFIYDKLPYDAEQGFPPDLAAGQGAQPVPGAPRPAGEEPEGVHRPGQESPGKLNYGSAGNGSAGHLAMEYLKMASETFILHVPYRGTGPQLTDLLAGRLDAASVGAAAVMQFIKTGKLRCIATGTTQRIAQLPDVPTVAEQGYPNFEMTQWYGMHAPASLPQAAIDRLATACAAAIKAPATVERLGLDAAIAVGSTPADFAKFIATERTRWKAVIARAGIKAD